MRPSSLRGFVLFGTFLVRRLVIRCVSATFALGPLVAGCAPAVAPAFQQPARFEAWTDKPAEYRIGTSDEITVNFPYNHELNTSGPVGPDGRFNLPLIGSVSVAGRSANALSSMLSAAYSSQLREPAITVSVTRYAHQRVYVGGEVKNSGAFPVDGQAGVLDEIMLAGGLLDTARSNQVVLIRRGSDGHPMLRLVDIQRFVHTGDVSQDVPVHPQDIIFVPKSRIAELDVWMDQFVNRGLPFNKSLDYVVSGGTVIQ